MAKIPVGRTISYAYSFAFGNYVRILTIVGLPMLLMAVVAQFVTSFETTAMSALPVTAVFPRMGVMAMFTLPMMALFIFIGAQMMAILTPIALGMDHGNSAIFSSRSIRSGMRLFGAYLLTGAIIFGVMIGASFGLGIAMAVVLIVLAISGVSISDPQSPAMLAGIGVVTAISYAVAIYGFVRLSFFLAPIAVVEERIDVDHSWRLTGGNFWRIFCVYFAVFIPPIAVQYSVLGLLLGHDLFPPFGAAPDVMNAWQVRYAQEMLGFWYVIWPLAVLLSVPIYGGLSAASAFAYRALVPVGAEAASRTSPIVSQGSRA